MLKALTALSRAIVLMGCTLAVVFVGCSASHTASPNSVLPGTPAFTSPERVNPFNLSTKNVIEKYPLPNPSSGPNNAATGSDKNVWFTETYAARISRMTGSGVVTEYTIPSGLPGLDIAVGAGGALWFTEGYNGGASNIGKITTTGHVTEFPLPSGEYGTGGIAKGPDGNMWFVDSLTNSVGKITPTGTVTEYTLPTAAAFPNDIVAGPDGNMWFTEGGYTAQVGKVSTAGVITEYPGPGYDLGGIAAGSDGNLYACTHFGIEQVTTSGVITDYRSPQTTQWNDIVLGPDKEMWSIVGVGDPQSDNGIQEFNTKTHTFSAQVVPDSSSLLLGGLTVGGDGDVWITANDDNSILVYEEKILTVGIRLNGELSFTDPNYGFELGYAVGTGTQTQTISLGQGESVQFKNLDTIPHSAAFLGNATANSAPWPATFTGSTAKSPAGTAIGTSGWATGSLNASKSSPIYETGLPGFYMIGDQYDYVSNNMRTVIIVH